MFTMVSFIISIVSFAYLLFIDDSYFVNMCALALTGSKDEYSNGERKFER